MANCRRVYRNGRLFAVVRSDDEARALINSVWMSSSFRELFDEWDVQPAYIEGIGF